MSTGSRLTAVGLVILALCLLRFVHLGADTPDGASPTGLGLYVDEGYKTLSARRLVLFGATRWDEADQFSGWLEESPLTQWSFYAGFRLFGADAESARIVTVLYFALFLGGYAWAFWRRYPGAIFWSGLIALGLESTLFFFSRAALFAIPVTTFVYMFIFGLARAERPRATWVIASLVLLGGIPIFAVKQSAAIYLVPLAVAPIWTLLLKEGAARRLWPMLVAASAAGSGVLYATSDVWRPRLQFEPMEVLGRILQNPTIDVSTSVVLAGVLCALHALLTRPGPYLRDMYRLSLLLMITLPPLAFTLFSYDPLRYYVPILPAYVLLVLEWVQLKGWKERLPDHVGPIMTGFAISVLTLCFFYAGSALNKLVLARVSLDLGRIPGVSDTASIVLVPVALIAALGVWGWRRVTVTPQAAVRVGWILIASFAIQSAIPLVSFFSSPSYRANEIREDLAKLVKEGETIAGDWAPFFALGTPIKAFYMHRRENPAADVLKISPDYFLHGSSWESDSSLSEIEEIDGVSIGAALYQSEYVGHTVILYPLRYEQLPDRKAVPSEHVQAPDQSS